MRSVLTFAALALVVSACASSDYRRASRQANPAPCPNVFVLEDASRFVEFGGQEAKLSNVVLSGEIDDVSTTCRYFADTPIFAEAAVAFSVGRMDASEAETIEVDYFVAVTRTNRDVIAKETFRVPVTFRAGQNVASVTQNIDRITIPRAGENTSGLNFEIAIGFALTEEQFRFNRSDQSLKFPES